MRQASHGREEFPLASRPSLDLIVSDIEASRKELLGRGIQVSEVFHQNSPDLQHGQGMAVDGHVFGGNDELRLRPLQASALHGYHTVGYFPYRVGRGDSSVGNFDGGPARRWERVRDGFRIADP